MESFFIVSLPGLPTQSDSLKQIKSTVSGVEAVYPLKFPELKVGTLDNLLSVADSVEKTDQFIQQVCYKIEKQIYEFQKNENPIKVEKKTIPEAFTTFEWDDSKYPHVKMPLGTIADTLLSEVTKIDTQMKEKANEFNQTKNQLTSINRRATGSLSVKALQDLISEEDFFQSEKMTTLFVVVPKSSVKEWTKSYDTLVENIVPRSGRLLAEDDQSHLYSLVLFKSAVEPFKAKAREQRFQVREFTHTGETAEKTAEEKKRLEIQLEEQLKEFVTWCYVSYAEVVTFWLHLKFLRVFTESVLRFGLPVNFQAVAVLPQKKNTKKVVDLLCAQFKALAFTPLSTLPSSGSTSTSQTSSSSSGTKTGEADEASLYPFVYMPVPLMMKMVL